jgi:hypothetical protein
MDGGRVERSEKDKFRWELVVARVGAELDTLTDDTEDTDTRDLAAQSVFNLYCAMMARAQELEAFAERCAARDPRLLQSLDELRLAFPLPVPKWDEDGIEGLHE